MVLYRNFAKEKNIIEAKDKSKSQNKRKNRKEDENMLTQVGIFLRQMRMGNNEILKEMATKLDVTSAFLSAIENGKKKMPKSMRNKIVKKYDLSKEDIDALDNAILESNDTVEINIRHLSNDRKELAISFARTFGELNDDDVQFFTDYLNRRSKGEKIDGNWI